MHEIGYYWLPVACVHAYLLYCMCVSVCAVHKSKCPGYIGITGIVVQETQNTLKLICKDNRVRSKFSLQLPVTAFTAHVHIT